MKKLCLILAILGLLFAGRAVGAEDVRVFINGEEITYEIPVVIRENRTLIPLRVVSENLGYNVEWSDAEKSVKITSDETEILFHIGKNEYYINGGLRRTDPPAQIIDDRAYVQLRAVAEAYGCIVDWSSSHRAAFVDEYPDEKTVLMELGFITEDEFNSEENISVYDALKFISDVYGKSPYDNLEIWYSDPELEPADHLPDETKTFLMGLCYSTNRPLLNTSEIPGLKLSDSLTNLDAFKYAVRLVASTGGCTDVSLEASFAKQEEIYGSALRHGFFSQDNIPPAGEHITKHEFYCLVQKALYIEHTVGGYTLWEGRAIENIIWRKNLKLLPEKEIIKNTSEIPVKANADSDLFFRWDIPEEYSFLITDDYSCEIGYVLENGTYRMFRYTGSFPVSIAFEDVVEMLVSNYPEKVASVRITYEKRDSEKNTEYEYYFDIDVSHINVIEDGEAPTPDVYVRPAGKWPGRRVSLKGGFEYGAYYVLMGYEHKYRNPEYNKTDFYVFKSDTDSDTYTFPSGGTFGVTKLDEVRIRKVVAETNDTGITLIMTGISEEKFNVTEE